MRWEGIGVAGNECQGVQAVCGWWRWRWGVGGVVSPEAVR